MVQFGLPVSGQSYLLNYVIVFLAVDGVRNCVHYAFLFHLLNLFALFQINLLLMIRKHACLCKYNWQAWTWNAFIYDMGMGLEQLR